MTRLQEHYQKTVVPALMEQFNYSSAMQVPRLEKITLNMVFVGLIGSATQDIRVYSVWYSKLTWHCV